LALWHASASSKACAVAAGKDRTGALCGLDRRAALDQSRRQLLFLNDITFWSLPQVRYNEAVADSFREWMIVMSGLHVVAILVRAALPG
jgi:hypothetical protein